MASRCEDRACFIFFADSGRRTQVMNFEGRREGVSSEGVEEPEMGWRKVGLGFELREEREEREERMPERMAMPIVPVTRSVNVSIVCDGEFKPQPKTVKVISEFAFATILRTSCQL